MKPLVSILIPAYNVQGCIAETIRSAKRQTWPRKEIIIVDDGSRDQTLAIARQFASNEICVVTQENQKAAATRNRAYALCQGDYIQWLDADDLLSPDKVERQMEVAERHPARRTLISSAWAYFMYRASKANFVPTPLWCDLSPAEWMTRKLEKNLHMQTATWLVTRELTEAAGPWNTRLLGDDDGEYFARVLLASDGVRFVPEAKVFYRVPGPASLSHIGLSEQKLEAQLLSMELTIKHIRSLQDSERVRAACVTYLQNWLPNFYPEHAGFVDRARRLAESVGGRLEDPRPSWKYALVKAAFGWPTTKRVQFGYNRIKLSLLRSWDKAWFNWEHRRFSKEQDEFGRAEVQS